MFNEAYYFTVTTSDYEHDGGGHLQSGQLVKIVIRRLTTGIRSEKCVVRRFVVVRTSQSELTQTLTV